jgi:1-acyl-sn-glycerol-3-phosphate acyltransferase
VAPALVGALSRLEVSGSVPGSLRGGPLILASNHIGTFDPVALVAACARLGLAPRMMATGGLFRTPVIGAALRACGHLRVDRGRASVTEALPAAGRALADRSVVAIYPEGRITCDPDLWPERGRSGAARLALTSGAAVVPVAQWGAHEVLAYDGRKAIAASLLSAPRRRPRVRVRFGPPVVLADLDPLAPASVAVATRRIMDAIVAELEPLRRDEPTAPRHLDPTRPARSARVHPRG